MFRAPNLNELYDGRTLVQPNLNDPCVGRTAADLAAHAAACQFVPVNWAGNSPAQVNTFYSGATTVGATLKPEKGKSVDLGLVYSMDVVGDQASGYRVDVAMTLTAPGCGMGPVIAEDAKTKILLVPGVGSADVRITWDPPWNQSMISEEGKMKLGLI